MFLQGPQVIAASEQGKMDGIDSRKHEHDTYPLINVISFALQQMLANMLLVTLLPIAIFDHD